MDGYSLYKHLKVNNKDKIETLPLPRSIGEVGLQKELSIQGLPSLREIKRKTYREKFEKTTRIH